ncbi:MAG: hypothetical protein V1709_06000 [Planctomycetota bacterium]
MKHPDEYTSYEYMKEQLYDKPHLYEKSFQTIRPYVLNLQNFESLKHLISFTSAFGETSPSRPDGRGSPEAAGGQSRNKKIRLRLKSDLITMDKTHRWLRPEIVEILMFILWDDLVENYGTGERFSESYWDLINEMEPQPQIAPDNRDNSQ